MLWDSNAESSHVGWFGSYLQMQKLNKWRSQVMRRWVQASGSWVILPRDILCKLSVVHSWKMATVQGEWRTIRAQSRCSLQVIIKMLMSLKHAMRPSNKKGNSRTDTEVELALVFACGEKFNSKATYYYHMTRYRDGNLSQQVSNNNDWCDWDSLMEQSVMRVTWSWRMLSSYDWASQS